MTCGLPPLGPDVGLGGLIAIEVGVLVMPGPVMLSTFVRNRRSSAASKSVISLPIVAPYVSRGAKGVLRYRKYLR
jgi:hypothetical protein